MLRFVVPLRWSVIASGVSCPAAVAVGERHVTLFVRGASGELLILERNESLWGEPRSLGIPLVRNAASAIMPVDWPIAACATGPDEIQLLARGPEGELLHGTLRAGKFGGFACIGSPAAWVGATGVPMALASAPAACSRTPGSMDVFAVGAAGALLHSTWQGDEFTEFESLGGVAREGSGEAPLAGPISATNCGPRAIAVAARGGQGDLIVKWWNGTSWTPFGSLGFATEPDSVYPALEVSVPFSSAPVACGGGSARLDVFVRGPRGDMLSKRWDGKSWTRYESMGRPSALKPDAPLAFSAVSLAAVWGRFQLDVFARATDGKLYHAASNESGDVSSSAS